MLIDNKSNRQQAGPSANAQSPAPTSSHQPRIKPARDDPPPYGNQAGTYPVQPLLYPNIQPYPDAQVPVFVYHEPTWLRFLKAFGVAVLIYLLFSMLVESIVLLAQYSHRHRRPHGRLPDHYAVPQGVQLQECTTSWERVPSKPMSPFVNSKHTSLEPSAFPLASETSFDLPLNSTSLLVFARGPMSAGDLHITTSPHQRSDSATVIVISRYFQTTVRDQVRACSLIRKDGSRGVGIFTPNQAADASKDYDQNLFFETIVILPESTVINRLETDVQYTAHRIVAEGNKIHFKELFLKGSNAPVILDGVSVKHAGIQTSNSPITGRIDTSDHLKLETSNAEVQVQVGMGYVPTARTSPKLDISTTNGPLRAEIVLEQVLSDQSTRNTPHYEVNTHTTNGRLDVSFRDAPSDAVLRFNGTTSNAAASTRLYPMYSGSYQIQADNDAVDLRVYCADLDSKLGCKDRKIRRHVVRMDRLSGVMEWMGTQNGSRKRVSPSGRVNLATSNGPAIVSL